jgi:hypothetical protein
MKSQPTSDETTSARRSVGGVGPRRGGYLHAMVRAWVND